MSVTCKSGNARRKKEVCVEAPSRVQRRRYFIFDSEFRGRSIRNKRVHFLDSRKIMPNILKAKWPIWLLGPQVRFIYLRAWKLVAQRFPHSHLISETRCESKQVRHSLVCCRRQSALCPFDVQNATGENTFRDNHISLPVDVNRSLFLGLHRTSVPHCCAFLRRNDNQLHVTDANTQAPSHCEYSHRNHCCSSCSLSKTPHHIGQFNGSA